MKNNYVGCSLVRYNYYKINKLKKLEQPYIKEYNGTKDKVKKKEIFKIIVEFENKILNIQNEKYEKSHRKIENANRKKVFERRKLHRELKKQGK